MVEAWVGEVERGDGDVPGVGYVAMRSAAGANAMGSPERGAVIVKGYIAFAFERSLARCFPKEEALGDEPAAEVGRFGAALLGVEAGEGGEAVVDEGGVSDEDHVGTAGLGVQEANVGDAAKYVVHALPLGES